MKLCILAIACLAAIAPAESLRKLVKTPTESYDYGVDFSPDAPAGVLSIVSATAADAVSGQDVTSQLIAATPAPGVPIGTSSGVVRLQNGVAGKSYLVSIQVVRSDNGEQFEGQFTVSVVAQNSLRGISKLAFESFDYGVDFSSDAPAGTLSITSATAIDASSGQDVTAQIIAAVPAPGIPASTSLGILRLQNGVAGHSYVISIKVARSDDGEEFDGEFTVKITN